MIIGNHSIVPRILLLTDGVFASGGLQSMTGMMAGGGRGQVILTFSVENTLVILAFHI